MRTKAQAAKKEKASVGFDEDFAALAVEPSRASGFKISDLYSELKPEQHTAIRLMGKSRRIAPGIQRLHLTVALVGIRGVSNPESRFYRMRDLSKAGACDKKQNGEKTTTHG